VLSLDQPRAAGRGDGASGSVGAHTAPFDGDVKVVGIEHSALVYGLHVQGAVRGAVT
jgi:hypothetical protein